MYNKDEKAVNLVDLCYFILKKWKLMVVVGVGLAVLAAGGTYWKSCKEYQSASELSAQDKLERIVLPESEKAALEAKMDLIEEYEKNIAEYDYYLQNALKMKLDPNCFYEGTIAYLISADRNADAIKAVELCYEQAFREENYVALAECLTEKTDVVLLKELVIVEEERYIDAFDNSFGADVLLRIRVQHYMQSECENMMTYYLQKLDGMHKIFDNKNLNVKFEKIVSNVGTCSDQSLVALSREIEAAKANSYDAIANIEKNITGAQKEYYVLSRQIADEASEESEIVALNSQKPSVDLLVAAIAGIAGAFLVAGVYGAWYLFDGRVHNKEELESWLNIPVFSAEESEDMIAALLSGIAEDNQAKSIYLVASMNGDVQKIEKLKELLQKQKIEVSIGTEILRDAKAIHDAAECGFVVFVEKCNVSKEKEIKEKLDKAASCGISVLGILLEK